MTIELGEDGQDWRVYVAALPKKGSPKKDSDVTSGYWRIESPKKFATPVATIFDSGMMIVRMGDADPLDRDCGDDWHRFCTNYWPKCRAVDYADYQHAVENGFWPDGLATSNRDAIGGNEGPEDAVERMLKEAEQNLEKAKALVAAGAAKTQAEADAAAILKANLTSPQAPLKEAHEKEKEPYLEASRKVDAKFLPLIRTMKEHAADIHKSVVKPFLDEQERLAKVAAAAAQAVIDQANEAARKAVEAETGKPVTEDEWQAAAPVAATVSTAKATAGVKGARASLRDVRYGKIDDAKAFASALIDGKVPEIMELLQQLANRMVRLNPDKPHEERLYPGVLVDVRRE